MKQPRVFGVLILAVLVCGAQYSAAATYRINGMFDGCKYGKLYELVGGGILECREYNYFYEYSPEVRIDGRYVIAIGDEVVDGSIHYGGVINTRINGEFEDSEYDKRYKLTNGLVFVGMTYSYSYSYMPEMKSFVMNGSARKVAISGKENAGNVYR